MADKCKPIWSLARRASSAASDGYVLILIEFGNTRSLMRLSSRQLRKLSILCICIFSIPTISFYARPVTSLDTFNNCFAPSASNVCVMLVS
jgi:hypothetical protein